jgi:SprT-like family.
MKASNNGGSAKTPSITKIEYGAFQQAYDFFNRELFHRELPNVLVTLQRKANTRGYFTANAFVGRGGNLARVEEGDELKLTLNAVHELALNPDHFGRTDKEILSTLVHEMAHVWQETCGNASKHRYHDKEWGAKMKSIGLQPSSTGEPGGKETGQKVSHWIIEGGPFDLAFKKLETKGFKLNWQARGESKLAKVKAASKTKYTCPNCEQNAWAKPAASLICGACFEESGELEVMLPEDSL